MPYTGRLTTRRTIRAIEELITEAEERLDALEASAADHG